MAPQLVWSFYSARPYLNPRDPNAPCYQSRGVQDLFAGLKPLLHKIWVSQGFFHGLVPWFSPIAAPRVHGRYFKSPFDPLDLRDMQLRQNISRVMVKDETWDWHRTWILWCLPSPRFLTCSRFRTLMNCRIIEYCRYNFNTCDYMRLFVS